MSVLKTKKNISLLMVDKSIKKNMYMCLWDIKTCLQWNNEN